MQPDIVCLGEPLAELNQTEPGQARFLQGHGGDTSNCAIAAARLGARVGYLTRVGADSFGDGFLEPAGPGRGSTPPGSSGTRRRRRASISSPTGQPAMRSAIIGGARPRAA